MTRQSLYAAFLAVSFGQAVEAQSAWSTYGTQATAMVAETCPLGSPSDQRFACFQLSCPGEHGMGFGLRYSGLPLSSVEHAAISVDSGRPFALNLRPIRTEQGKILFETWDDKRHTHLMRALKVGRRASLDVSRGPFTLRFNVSLRGSSRALDAAHAACTTLPQVNDPLAKARAAARDLCAQLDGEVHFRTGFFTEPDINNDGHPDLQIDYGKVECSAARALFCASQGCQTDLYIGTERGGYQLVLREMLDQVTTETRTILKITKRGPTCGNGATRATLCTQNYTMDASGTLIPFDLKE